MSKQASRLFSTRSVKINNQRDFDVLAEIKAWKEGKTPDLTCS